MSRYNHPHTLSKTTIALHLLGGLLAVVLLSILCPHEATTKLEYHIREPWDNDALIAKDSFDVYKNQEQYKKEQDSLKTLYEPYFNLQSEVAQEVVSRFKGELDSLTKEEPAKRAIVSMVVKDLAYHYEMGIVDNDYYDSLKVNKTSFIHRYSHPSDTTLSADRVYSVRTTLEDIMAHSDNVRSILQRSKISQYIQPNLTYNPELSQIQQAEINKFATVYSGRVLVGEKIVDRGQIVTQEIKDKLDSYQIHEKQTKRTTNEHMSQIGGNALYIMLVILALYIFLFQFRSDYLYTRKHLLLIYLQVLFFPVICYALANSEYLSIYVVPYCMAPIFMRVFMDSRTAFATHITIIMLCALATNHSFEFSTIQILAGMATIYSLKQLQQRSELFTSVVIVTSVSLLVNLCMDLILMNFFSNHGVDGSTYIYILINGLLLFMSYLLLFPIEKVFGFTSMVTLIELSNINHPVLRRLSEEAPGTFQHSMQVANLAAAVANDLGAKSQLVRTGALYHDIGKLKEPINFTENQTGFNPHSTMSFEDSAQVIIQHVRYGLELADKYNLPPDIKELIATHHGRSKTKYFYVSYRNANPDGPVNDEIFTYPGPNPTTIEHAILMMADAVEAASRCMGEYTEESISNIVDRIIDSQLQEGCFRQCDITFANIDKAKETFKEKLKSIYHTRINYPELSKEVEEADEKAAEVDEKAEEVNEIVEETNLEAEEVNENAEESKEAQEAQEAEDANLVEKTETGENKTTETTDNGHDAIIINTGIESEA